MLTRIVVGLCSVVLLACTLVRAQPLADRVPEDVIVYVGWSGSHGLGDAYKDSHLKAILDNSKIRELFTQFLPQLGQKLAVEEPEAAEPIRIISTLAAPMWKHPTAFFAGIDFSNPEQPMPKVGLLCQAGNDAAAVHQEVEALLAQAGETPVPVHTFAKDGLVAVLVGYEDAEKALAGPGGAVAALGGSPAFTAAMKHVQPQPVAMFFFNVERLIGEVEGVIQQIDDEQAKEIIPKALDASGLRGLKRIVRTSAFDGKDWMSMTFVEAPAPRAGLLSVMEPKPVSTELLNAIPPDATFVATARLDAARFIKQLRTSAAEVHPEAPKFIDMGLGGVQIALAKNPMTDILEPMGEDWAAYCSPTVGGNGFLGIVLINRLDDPAKAQQSLPAATINLSNWIGVALSRQQAPVEVRVRTTKIGEQTVYYFGTPILAPAWTMKGEYLYLGLFPQTAAAGARAGARQDANFAENEKFRALMKRLNVSDAVSFSFYDLPAVAGQGSMYQQWMMLARYGGFGDLFGIPLPEPLMPSLDLLQEHLAPAGSAAWIDDAGYHVKEISPFPGAKMLSEPGILAGGGGVLSAIGVGAGVVGMTTARQQAEQQRGMMQLRQLGMHIMVYANEHNGEYPDDLAALARHVVANDPGQARIFIHGDLPPDVAQMNPDQLADWVNDNSSFVYLGGEKDANADADTILMYERPGARPGNQIGVLFGDGHVEQMPTARAGAKLAEQGVEMQGPRGR